MVQNRGPRLLVVGGFLGAGKTRLILRAASLLEEQGIRTAVVTNDQADELVDTQWTEHAGIHTAEIAGGCFCCRFSEFIHGAQKLLAYSPDVIFAEPVGSCTDLTATVLEPMRALYAAQFQVGPLTILIDPTRIALLLNGDPDIGYLVRKQMEEADLLCFSKSDLGETPPLLEGIPVIRQLSAKTGDGVAAWLDEVLDGNTRISRRVLDIDYQRYAKAEAALGWLNAKAELNLHQAASPAMIVGPLLEKLDILLSNAAGSIAHLKIFDHCSTGVLKASMCGNGEEPEIEGDFSASPANRHLLTLNLRAEADPETLLEVVRKGMENWPEQSRFLQLQAFRPAAPQPEHRFEQIREGDSFDDDHIKY